MKFTGIAVGIFCSIYLHAEILLFSFHHNRPDFIEVQYKAIKKFLKEKNDCRFIVFNDATDQKVKTEIEKICERLCIECVNYPQNLHHTGELFEKMKPHKIDGTNGSVRHCQLVQYALDNFGYEHDDIVGIMEGDVFLIRDFSVREALKDSDFIGAVQTDRSNLGIEYIWIGLNFFKPQNLPNKNDFKFDLTFRYGRYLDSGGWTYYYLMANPSIRVKKYYRIPIVTLTKLDSALLKEKGYSESEIKFLKKMINYRPECVFSSVEFHLDNNFIHFCCSRFSNPNDFKSKAFAEFFEEILE